jgi:hypothetical protein
MAAMPAGIESCRNPSVFEKTRIVKVGATEGAVCTLGEAGAACPHAAAMIAAATLKIEIFFNPAIFNLAINRSIYNHSISNGELQITAVSSSPRPVSR